MAIALIFVVGCKKENKEEQQAPSVPNENSEYCYNIDELIKETGIDIYALSKLKVIKDISYSYTQIELMETAKTEISDQIEAQIRQLKVQLERAAQIHDNELYSILFEQLTILTRALNGLRFTVNANGLTIIDYIEGLEAVEREKLEVVRGVGNENPEFYNLSEDLQEKVLAAAMYQNFLEDEALFGPTTCAGLKAALVGRLTAYTAAYIVTAGLCGGTTFAVFVCEGIAYATYVDATVTAINQYKKDIKNCTN